MPNAIRTVAKAAARAGAETTGECWSSSLRIDVFTLFPEAFDWFRGQRHVAQRARRAAASCGSSTTATPPRSAAARSTTPPTAAAPGWCCGSTSSTRRSRPPTATAAARAGDPARARGPPARRGAGERARRRAARWRCSAGATRGSTSASASTSTTDAVSVGPYVLAGGELAAMVVADAVLRKLPGALGHAESAVEESFSEALGRRAGVPALHAPGRATAAGRCPRSCSPAITRAYASGGLSAAASAARRRPALSYHSPPRGSPRGRSPVPLAGRAALSSAPQPRHEHDHREHRAARS